MAQNLSLKCDNYLVRGDLRMFLDRETSPSEFGPIGYRFCLFLLLVHPDGLPIRRASINNRLIGRIARGAFFDYLDIWR